jgi:hypothetical protein
MPQMDVEAQRRAARRAYLKGLKRGDFVKCALPMQTMAMQVGGQMVDVTPERTAAEREAEEKARWDFSIKYGLG